VIEKQDKKEMSSSPIVKAIKIDVASRTIYEVEVASNGLQGMYDAIGNGCDMVQIGMTFAPARNQRHGDSMWVDEEGLYRPIKGGFKLGSMEQPFCGNALIFGNIESEDGGQEFSDYTLPIEILKQHVSFLEKDFFDNYQPTISVTSW
jgi:hypothetical protein